MMIEDIRHTLDQCARDCEALRGGDVDGIPRPKTDRQRVEKAAEILTVLVGEVRKLAALTPAPAV